MHCNIAHSRLAKRQNTQIQSRTHMTFLVYLNFRLGATEKCTGVHGRDMGIEDSTGKEIGGRRNENATMDMCGVTKLDKIRNERIRGTTNVGEIARKSRKGSCSGMCK